MAANQPTILFILGGSGDLTYRKLIPALYNLYLDEYLPQQFLIVGIGRISFSQVAYKAHVKKGVQEFSRRKKNIAKAWKAFSEKISYHTMDVTDDKGYKAIVETVKDAEKEWKTKANLIFYLSVAPQLTEPIVKHLHDAELTKDCSRSRLVFEKPFGHDLRSATELNGLLNELFKEEQIYRIDHYLGKETVQNILAFRFANALFEPTWNSHYIDHVQITAAETVTVGDRGGYYESAGALRDMVQNHMLQLLCMIAMEPPVSFKADEVRNKKLDVLKAIRCFKKGDVHRHAVRGQYSTGWMKGDEVKGYRQEKGVQKESPTETFVAIKFYVDNWRWKGVPFYLRTGKGMTEKSTIITIDFKSAPDFAFPPEGAETWRANRLTISIQPQMDIRLRFQAKQPGPDMRLLPVDMAFNYSSDDGNDHPEAYETLLLDVIEGDATLFMRGDQVEAAWKIITPIQELWAAKPPVDFPNYAPGSWGPEDAEALIARDGRHWASITPEPNSSLDSSDY